MACPMRSESDASGDTFSCLDVPNSAYISPGMDAENYQPQVRLGCGTPQDETHQAGDRIQSCERCCIRNGLRYEHTSDR